MRLKKEHIHDEWDEYGSNDGYWITLKQGYKWGGDPKGNCHTIHENTKKECYAQEVLQCNCTDCMTKVYIKTITDTERDSIWEHIMKNG